MSMTTAYLKTKCTPVQPEAGKRYRVIGFKVSGAIYQVQMIENGLCHFKGYFSPREVDKMQFFTIELSYYINKRVKLKEMPQLRFDKPNVTVGNDYLIVDVEGSNFWLIDDDGEKTTFGSSRFDL